MGANLEREWWGESGFSLLFVRALREQNYAKIDLRLIHCEMLRVACDSIGRGQDLKVKLRLYAARWRNCYTRFWSPVWAADDIERGLSGSIGWLVLKVTRWLEINHDVHISREIARFGAAESENGTWVFIRSVSEHGLELLRSRFGTALTLLMHQKHQWDMPKKVTRNRFWDHGRISFWIRVNGKVKSGGTDWVNT